MPFSYPTTQDLMQPVVPPKESIENNLELETREINDSDEEVEGLLTNRRESVSDEVEKMTRRVSNGELRRSSSKSFNNSGNIGVGRKSSLSSSGRVSGLMNRLLGEMPKRERSIFFREMLTQTLPILLLSLMGALFTGELLSTLQNWPVFIRVEELFILVPILLNLKGNLEMNLAARFSTSSNIGELDLRATRRSLILGNLALLQVQALLVSLFSGLLSFILGIASRNGVHHALQHPIYKGSEESLRGGYFEALLVLCVSMLAAGLSSAVLGSFMCSLVVSCRRFRINPDNIATPLASALGDLLTLTILGVVSSGFAKVMGTVISSIVFLFLLVAIGVNVVITFRNAYVQELLTIGWAPLFIAMLISSGTGLILETYVNEFTNFALFSPVVTALAGNAGSILVSRISTSLHSNKKEPIGIVSITLFLITCPVLLLFLIFVWATGQLVGGWSFAIGYCVVVAASVTLSLLLAQFLALLLWRWDYDPDVYALPLLSSIIDCTGQLMLVGAFTFARAQFPKSGVGVS